MINEIRISEVETDMICKGLQKVSITTGENVFEAIISINEITSSTLSYLNGFVRMEVDNDLIDKLINTLKIWSV